MKANQTIQRRKAKGDRMTAKTPNGHKVTVQESAVGTACRQGAVFFGVVRLACYCNSGSGLHTLDEALVRADERIDTLGLSE